LDSVTVHSYCRIRRLYGTKVSLSNESSHYINSHIEILPKTIEFPPGFPYSNQMYSAENIENPIVKGTGQFFIEGKAPKLINDPQKKLLQSFLQDPFDQSQITTKHKPSLLGHEKKFMYNAFEFKGPEDCSQSFEPPTLHSIKEHTKDNSSSNKKPAKSTRGVSVPPKSTFKNTQGWTNDFTPTTKKLISSKQEAVTQKKKVCEGKLDVRDYLLDGSQFNSFSLPIVTNSKETTKDQVIEEIIEVDEKALEDELYQDSLIPATPLMSMVPEPNLFSKTSKDICVKEVSKEDSEDSKLDDQIEMLGANNPSLLDYANRLRPFSPPFAQMNVKKGKTKETKNTYKKKKTVVYDPVLKCYYDPRNDEYYHVN